MIATPEKRVNQASGVLETDGCTSQPCPVSCLNLCRRSIPAIKLLTSVRHGASHIHRHLCHAAYQPPPLVLAVGIKLPGLAPSCSLPCSDLTPLPSLSSHVPPTLLLCSFDLFRVLLLRDKITPFCLPFSSSSIFSTSRFHVFCSLNHVTLVFVYLSVIDMIT